MNIFEEIKNRVDFPVVFKRFLPGAKIKNNKTTCPFHEERTASFHIYPDGGHCYGCGWHGDAVAFVVAIGGVRPIEAAQAIAGEFNISIPQSGRAGARRYRRRRRRPGAAPALTPSQAQGRYRKLKQMAFLALAEFRDLATSVFETEKLDVGPEIAQAVHMLPVVEHYLEVLAIGSEEERLQLLREGVLTRWVKLRNYQKKM